ncbi:MAG: S8/S53 family peptidase [Candidatus Sericytochromatia bacterium]|nr:S8/S53 family peptidase [Candidatus Sericytochromatia bacterium]
MKVKQGEGFTKISVCLVNGVEEQILTGRMVVEFSGDYNTKLSTFLKRYNAILFNSFVTRDDTLMALVGLGDNPDLVNNISKNIQKTNQIASPSTESMTFSSIDALKTVAVYYDIFANSSDIVSGVSFNHPAYQQSVASFPIPATTSNTGAGVDEIVTNEESSTGTKSTDLEWLVNKSPFSPEITKAWSRSQGEDSVVAIIDSGFGTIDKYKDFKDRVIYKPELLINDYNEYKTYCQQVRSGQDPSKIKYPNGNFVFSTSDTNIDVPTNLASAVTPDCYPNKLQNKLNTACVYNEVAYRGACYNDTEIKKNYTLVNPPAHGFEVSSIIASTSDDFSHISGVAPKVKILPIAYNSKSTIDDYTFLLAISKVNDYLTFGSSYEKRKVDVISISTALSLQNSIWAHLQTFNCSNCINSTSVVFKKTGRLSNNPLEYYLNNFISYYSQDLKIPVVVGAGNNGDYADTYLPAICDDAITVGAYEIYNTNSTSSIRRASFPILNPFASSNYGKSVDLWANGRGTYTFLPQPNTSNSVYDFKSLQGSSFSTPIVAGVISLLKSWNKNLNGQDIKKILLERGYNLPINGDFRVPSGSNQKAINALASIIDIRVGAKKSITITGIYNSNNTVNPDSDNNSFYNTLKLTKDYTNLYSSFIGKKVTITGWLARDRNFINPSLTIAPIEDFELAQMKEKPSTNVPSRWYVRIYNIDDTGYAYVNLNNVATAYYSQDTGYIDVTSMISAGNNNFTFKTYNYSGGYTWGFQVKKDNNIVFNDISGSAGSYGANNNDQTKSYQYVYNHIITIDANGNVAANKNNLP